MYIMKKLLPSTEWICQVIPINLSILRKKVLHIIGRMCRMIKSEKWSLIFMMLFSFLGFSCFLSKFQDWETAISLLVIAGILLISYGASLAVWLGLKALGAYLEKY